MSASRERRGLRQVGHGIVAALVFLFLSVGVSAADRTTDVASIHIAVRYDPATFAWRGTFRALRPDGALVAQGRVIDRPRQKLGVEWFITRTLVTRQGTLRFRISGPFRTSTARLHWQLVGGTGPYAALHGRGVDVEHVRKAAATAVMRRVPLP